MGGQIGADSVLGQGSRFWVVLPLAPGRAPDERCALDPAAPQAAPDIDALRTGNAGRHVLLAEDNPLNQEIARELQENVGLKVSIAQNGQEAVEMAGQADYDLILMDLSMPVMGGLEAATAIRALPTYSTRPILALTANAFAEDRQHCLEAGMNDHLAKPVTPTTLYQALARWMPAQGAPTPRAETPADTPRPTPALRHFVAELGKLLDENDVRAGPLWREQGRQLEALVGPGAGQIGQAIELFEFEEAATLLAGIVATHPELGEQDEAAPPGA